MSTSTTLPPIGQRHDREDAIMQDGLSNGMATTQEAESRASPNDVAVEVAAVPADEDAMDTTADDPQNLVLPNGTADPQNATATTPTSPAPNGVEDTTDNVEPPPTHPEAVCFPSLITLAH
jgi:hypothetical protein